MSIFTLLKKDLLIELRSREMLISMCSLAVMTSLLSAIGMHGAVLEASTTLRVYPTLLWIGFIFAGTISISRSLHQEFEFRAIDGLLAAGTSSSSIFISKMLTNTVVTTLMFVLLSTFLSGLLDIQVAYDTPALITLGLVVSFGYSALSTLCAALTINAKLRELLLPLILIPLLFPLFFAGHELSTQIMTGTLDTSSPWLTLLLVLDLIYVVLGINLFDYAVRG